MKIFYSELPPTTAGAQRAYKMIRSKTTKHPKSKDALTHKNIPGAFIMHMNDSLQQRPCPLHTSNNSTLARTNVRAHTHQ